MNNDFLIVSVLVIIIGMNLMTLGKLGETQKMVEQCVMEEKP